MHPTRALPFCVIVAWGCATSPSSPSSPTASSPPAPWTSLSQPTTEPGAQPADAVLSAADFEAERALVLLAMEHGYGGRAFVAKDAWSAMMNRIHEVRAPITVGAWCDALAEAFWELPDAHLRAARQSIPDRYNERCGTSAQQQARKPSAGANRGRAAEGIPWSSGVENGVAWISITSFPAHGAPAWRGFDEAVTAARGARAIIVDLRGNGGGDDSRGYDLARALRDAPVSETVVRTHLRQKPETLTLLLNTIDRGGRGADGVLAPHLEELYTRIAMWRSDVLRSPPADEYRVEPNVSEPSTPGPAAFTGRVAILVDAACASSCESSLDVLRRHPTARVFGQRTAGFIHFGDVGSFTLPRSGIRLGIPTKFSEYPGGEMFDKKGFAPDVEVPAGSDAWETAVRWLNEGT